MKENKKLNLLILPSTSSPVCPSLQYPGCPSVAPTRLKYELYTNVFPLNFYFHMHGFSSKVTWAVFAYKKQWRNLQRGTLLESEKREYIFHIFYQSCKVVVVNWALSSLHGGSLKIKLTVPLKKVVPNSSQ